MPLPLEAIPTEYKGIRYRSKCEAMFARFLELENDELVFLASSQGPHFENDSFGRLRGGFIYEPKGLTDDGWTPDFLLWECSNGWLYKARIPTLNYTIIEYKPSKPAEAYIEKFSLNCNLAIVRMQNLRMFEFAGRCSAKIYYGSVFNSDRGMIYCEGGEYTLNEDYWLATFEDEIRATRFDLVQTISSKLDSK